MNLYVSNLAYGLTDDELRREFEAYGAVSNARVVLDRETGRSRGFGFVEMPNDAEAQAALTGLEGANVGGRPLRVVVARPKEDRPPPRSFGGGAGGGGGSRERSGGGGGGGNRDYDRGGGGRGGDRGNDRGGGKRDWSRERGGKRDWGGGEGDDY